MTRRAAAAIATTILAAATAGTAAAEPVIRECIVDLPASEGAWVTLLEDGTEVRQIVLTIAGEMGAIEMAVTPLPGGDAILMYRGLEYSRHAFAEQGPIDIFLRDDARAVVRGGRICEEDLCLTGGLEREYLQEFYDEFARAYEARFDCSVMFGG